MSSIRSVALLAACCAACRAALPAGSASLAVGPEPRSALFRFPDDRIALACAKPVPDTSIFRVGIIVDSLDQVSGGVLTIDVRRRPQESTYRNVTTELQLPADRQLRGTACEIGTGIVFRLPAAALRGATLHLDPPGRTEVWIRDGAGKPIASPLGMAQGPGTATLGWGRRRGTT